MTHPPIRRRRPSSHAPISRKRAAIVGELMKSEIICENAALSLPPLPPPPPCMIPVAGRRSPPPLSRGVAHKYCNKISTIPYASVVSLIQHNTARRANRPTDRQTGEQLPYRAIASIATRGKRITQKSRPVLEFLSTSKYLSTKV